MFVVSLGYSNDPGNSVLVDNYSVAQIGGPDPTLLGTALNDDPTNGYFTNFDGQSLLSGASLGPGLLDSFTLSAGATPGVYTLDLTVFGDAPGGGVATQANVGLVSLTIDAPTSGVPEVGTAPILSALLLTGAAQIYRRRVSRIRRTPQA